MSKSFDQITFEFGGEEEHREFLSGRLLPQPVPKAKSTRGRKSIKENEAEQENVAVPPDDILFKKHYYSIGEVAQMFGVNTSLIRYWETNLIF
jgi:hypothetical protein